MVAAPYFHALHSFGGIPLSRITEEPFIMRERGSGTRMATENCFDKHGIKLNVRVEPGSNEAIKQAVQAGLGLGIVSLHTLEMELALNRLAILDVESFPILRHWYIVYRSGKRLSPVTAAFTEFLLKNTAQLLKPQLSSG